MQLQTTKHFHINAAQWLTKVGVTITMKLAIHHTPRLHYQSHVRESPVAEDCCWHEEICKSLLHTFKATIIHIPCVTSLRHADKYKKGR